MCVYVCSAREKEREREPSLALKLLQELSEVKAAYNSHRTITSRRHGNTSEWDLCMDFQIRVKQRD